MRGFVLLACLAIGCHRSGGAAAANADAARNGSESVRIEPPPAQTGTIPRPANPDLARRVAGSMPAIGIVSDPGLAALPGTCQRLIACCDALRPLAAAAPLVQTYCAPTVAAPARDAGDEAQCLVNLRLLATRIPAAGTTPDACVVRSP
jgi:hypothetical protein